MSEQETITEISEEKVVKEEIKNPYSFYLLILFTIYLASLLVPAIIFMAYLILFFIPNFLETTNFISLFTEFRPLLALITMPLVLIGCYLIRLFFIGLITRGFWSLSEKRSPSKEGIIPRNFPSKILNYYQLRGFMIKQGKNAFMKGPFPWFSNWYFNFIGSNKIGRGTVFEESVTNDKFIEVGENCYIGVNSSLASHVVEGIFGNISYFKVKTGDNFTAAASNVLGPGSEAYDNSYLLPLAATPKHSKIKGDNYYWGMPLRRIFKKKIMKYLRLKPKDLEETEIITKYKGKKLIEKVKLWKRSRLPEIQPKVENQIIKQNEELVESHEINQEDLRIDFTTSSAISRVNIKFLLVYIPIFWLAGMFITVIFYTFTYYVQYWPIMAFFLPAILVFMLFMFILACFFFTELFLILINLFHKPVEGVFKAEKGSKDFEFWCLRTEIKKIVLWLMRNSPIPWMDILAFKWFGVEMNLSSSLYDSWTDAEFIKFGRSVIVGQGATVMSSMVIGKYLIIKKVIFDDYAMVGGQSIVAPGTIVGKDSVVGAVSTTTYNQVLEPGWIYFGIPVIKLKPNKYAEQRRDILTKRDVDAETKFQVEHEVNVEKNKKDSN